MFNNTMLHIEIQSWREVRNTVTNWIDKINNIKLHINFFQ